MKILWRKTFVYTFTILLILPLLLASTKTAFAGACSNVASFQKDLDSFKHTPAQTAELQGKIDAAKIACNAENAKDGVAPEPEGSSKSGAAKANPTYGLLDPLGGADIAGVISRLIKFLLQTSGSVAFLMFVWGGFQYLWSAGDENKVKKGKSTLVNATLGLVIIFTSYMLINTLIKALSM